MTTPEVDERRNAELELVQSAFDPSEVQIIIEENTVVRRFQPRTNILIELKLYLPPQYPVRGSLQIHSSKVECGSKYLHENIHNWTRSCQEVAEQWSDSESIFVVLSHANETLEILVEKAEQQASEALAFVEVASTSRSTAHDESDSFGRKLIYAHHIIAKSKRSEIKRLAVDLELTGYCKIGWPGLIIVEGKERHCQEFYDTIRQWNWKFLTVRGEMTETSCDYHRLRCFREFVETEDMSVVAHHCRDVGLDDLFLTSMKIYDQDKDNDLSRIDTEQFGVLTFVDHMNRPKAYRKWLRKTAQEYECLVMIKECNRAIFVAIIGNHPSVTQDFLKKWRTHRVDVDSKGKPCFERMMSVLHEGMVTPSIKIDWNNVCSDDNVRITRQELVRLLGMIGGDPWKEVGQNMLSGREDSQTE